jgi:hypothetical protein
MDATFETKDKHVTCEADDGPDHAVGTTTTIYIDPAREAAVRRKFDIYVVPVSVIYLVMSTLDRNNVSHFQIHNQSTAIANLDRSAWKRPRLRLR